LFLQSRKLRAEPFDESRFHGFKLYSQPHV
jgi:hypothetical protein